MVWDYKVDRPAVKKLATTYAEKHDSDVILVFGELSVYVHFDLHTIVQEQGTTHKDVLVVLSTFGGSPHAAYAVGRFLQTTYDQVRIFVPTWCKSAGTLLATAAHELFMTDIGELGPIDIQQTRHDQWDSMSGLVETAATKSLQGVVQDLFDRLVSAIRDMGRVTFKTAAEVASSIVVPALAPIYGQIDPLRLGEAARGLEISSEYAKRLNAESNNLEADAVQKLVSGFPDHLFAIDRKETDNLFKNVHMPDEDLMEIRRRLGPLVYHGDRAIVEFLNEVPKEETDAKRQEDSAAKK